MNGFCFSWLSLRMRHLRKALHSKGKYITPQKYPRLKQALQVWPLWFPRQTQRLRSQTQSPKTPPPSTSNATKNSDGSHLWEAIRVQRLTRLPKRPGKLFLVTCFPMSLRCPASTTRGKRRVPWYTPRVPTSNLTFLVGLNSELWTLSVLETDLAPSMEYLRSSRKD